MAKENAQVDKLTKLSKQLKEANRNIETLSIKDKQYAPVNERLKAFRSVYPKGRVKSEMLSLENGVVLFEATIYDNEGNNIANAHAYEKEDSSFINKTSFIENAETSAIGRALGIAGFGIDVSVASADEVTNAIENQEVPITKGQLEELINNKDKLIDIFKQRGIKGTKELKKLTIEEADELLRLLDEQSWVYTR